MQAWWDANSQLTPANHLQFFVERPQQKQSFVSLLGKAVDLNTKVTRRLSLDFQVTRLMPNDSLKSFTSRPKKKWESHRKLKTKRAANMLDESRGLVDNEDMYIRIPR